MLFQSDRFELYQRDSPYSMPKVNANVSRPTAAKVGSNDFSLREVTSVSRHLRPTFFSLLSCPRHLFETNLCLICDIEGGKHRKRTRDAVAVVHEDVNNRQNRCGTSSPSVSSPLLSALCSTSVMRPLLRALVQISLLILSSLW